MGLLVALSVEAVPDVKSKAKEQTGEQIFRGQCAACHGAKGQGTKLYQKPLIGSQSVGQLAKYIAQSMPPGPKKCAAKDAPKVAAYIYDAFYSSLAQARNRPARIELSHLTVRQYRNAIADLIGSFRDGPRPDQTRGLNGEYFKIGRFRGDERVLERIDPQIQFDFGTNGALPAQTDPYQMAMRWAGSVLAPDTGEYEFIVHTEHAMRLWINDLQRPIIDASVQSGTDNEYRVTLFLLGGRAYPLRLEFSKGVQGVDNLEKLKQKPPAKATLLLQWRPPKLPAETIPQRYLLPVTVPQTFSIATAFPPDDRSTGYERGTAISKAWDEATTEGALETAGYVVTHLRELSGVPDDAKDRADKLRLFCRQFVERAFRRPFSADMEKIFIEKQFQRAPDVDTAVKRVVLLALKSPRFLYREVGSGGADSYSAASRLSFGLWDAPPDKELMKAAADGQLTTRDQVVKQAERMVADPRAWFKLREFFLQWLKVDNYPDLAKDAKQFPGFDSSVASDLRTSLELFLEQVVWNGKSDYRDLLLSDKMYLNGRLAKIYGANLPPEAPFQPVSLDSGERAGVLTQPYLMSSLAYFKTSSPIHRGVLVARNMLGRTLQPPPQAFTPLAAELHPNLTTRQRVSLQTKPAACASCHGLINPLGFTMEKFDAIGRFHKEENGKPIDASGTYQPVTGKAVKFSGARDLANYLVNSEEARSAFVEKLFHHLVKQPVRAFGPKILLDLQKAFETNEFSIRKEMIEIMAVSAL